MPVVSMSHSELSRYDTLLRVERAELRVEDAAALLGVGPRQIYRLLGRLRIDGAEALVSWKRGRPSNRDFGEAFRAHVLELVREHYDFGPTLATEYLAERHGIGLHQIRTRLAHRLLHPRRGRPGHCPLHRWLLQPRKAPFRARLHQPRRVRTSGRALS